MDSSIKFNVSANTAQFQSGMKQVDAVAKSTAAGIKQAFSGVQSMLVGGAALAGLKTLMNDFDKVAKVATRFGASAEEIQRVSVAADLAGTNIDTVARVLTKLSVAASDAATGNKEMAKSFERAGIDAEKFKNAGLDQQLVQLSEAFNRARGDADATNQIIELMGTRAASQMIPLIDNTTALRQEMEGVSVASDDVVRKIEAANDRLTRLFNNIKVGFADAIGFITDTSERFGSLLGGAGFKTIAELEEIEARANAINQLTREGVFGFDAVKNAELIAERTKEILEQTRGTNQQIQIAEDMTEKVVSLEKEKTAELARQAEQLERQERQRQDAIRSMEAEIALIEAKLSGNKALEESLREQADFQAAFSKTGSFEAASNFAATKAAERSAANAPSGNTAGSAQSFGVLSGTRSTSALQALQAAARTDIDARTALMRLQNEQNRAMNRAGDLRERGFFRSAARAELRAERNAERAASRELQKQFTESMFGSRVAGDAFRNFENDARRAGMTSREALSRMGVTRMTGESSQDAFKRFVSEQSLTEKQRTEREQQAGEKQVVVNPIPNGIATEDTLQRVLQEIIERLPQNALAA